MTTSAHNPEVEAIRQSLQASYAELNALLDGPLAPLDASKLYQTPIEGEWSLMQNLAHIVEFLPYWSNEIAKLVARPGQNFGRTQQHEGRLHGIEEHQADTLAQIKAELPHSYARLEQVVNTLQDSDLSLTGYHVRFQEQTLAWFIHEFVTQHFADHLTQMQAILAALKTS